MAPHSSPSPGKEIERIGQARVHPGGAGATLAWTYLPGRRRQAAYVAPPDGGADVVVALRDGGASILLVGPTTTATSKPTGDIVLTCAARLRPGIAPLLVGAAARSLRGLALPLDAPWARQALDEVLAASSPERAARRLVLRIDERLGARPRPRLDPADAARIARGAARLGPELSMGRLARGVGVSERTLRRVFDDAIGLTPRDVRALPRFRRALAALAQPGGARDGAAIAAAAGYADQAHMIRDVRARTGQTPEALRRTWRARGVVLRPAAAETSLDDAIV